MPRLRVGVIFGGRSEGKLQVVPIGIGRDGRWVVGGDPMRALAEQARVALPSGDDTGAVKKALADRAEGVLSPESSALVRSEPAGSVPSELRQGLDVVSRGCWSWPTCRTSGPACSPRPWAWTRSR